MSRSPWQSTRGGSGRHQAKIPCQIQAGSGNWPISRRSRMIPRQWRHPVAAAATTRPSLHQGGHRASWLSTTTFQSDVSALLLAFLGTQWRLFGIKFGIEAIVKEGYTAFFSRFRIILWAQPTRASCFQAICLTKDPAAVAAVYIGLCDPNIFWVITWHCLKWHEQRRPIQEKSVYNNLATSGERVPNSN